jgi:hypothetical protein
LFGKISKLLVVEFFNEWHKIHKTTIDFKKISVFSKVLIEW